MKILFRSAGGLGNQIFQLFFVRLIADTYKITKISHFHEHRYARSAFWEYPLSIEYFKTNWFETLILKSRLPKILCRIGLINNEYMDLYPYILIDGYFQSIEIYKKYDKTLISKILIQIKFELLGSSNLTPKSGTILHLRLGDFFSSMQERDVFIERSLTKIKSGTTVISNQDELFRQGGKFQNLIDFKHLNYIQTENYSGIELIKLMSKHRSIISNGSTLALWASVLSGAEFSLNKFDYQLLNNTWMIGFSQKFKRFILENKCI